VDISVLESMLNSECLTVFNRTRTLIDFRVCVLLNESESQSRATELTSFRYDTEGNRTNSSVSPAQ